MIQPRRRHAPALLGFRRERIEAVALAGLTALCSYLWTSHGDENRQSQALGDLASSRTDLRGDRSREIDQLIGSQNRQIDALRDEVRDLRREFNDLARDIEKDRSRCERS